MKLAWFVSRTAVVATARLSALATSIARQVMFVMLKGNVLQVAAPAVAVKKYRVLAWRIVRCTAGFVKRTSAFHVPVILSANSTTFVRLVFVQIRMQQVAALADFLELVARPRTIALKDKAALWGSFVEFV